MRILAIWAVIFWIVLCNAQKAFAGQGKINVQGNECPTSVAASVLERADSSSRVLGAIADGSNVYVDLSSKNQIFYWVQGDGYQGKLLGYVYKGCLTITGENDPPEPVDCKKFSEYLPGCTSFNEMLAADDKGVVSKLTGLNHGYVCFRTAEDVFTIISIRKPAADLFKKVVGDPELVEMFAVATIERYKNGLSEDWQAFSGKWSKLASDAPDQATFLGSRGSKSTQRDLQGSVAVDASEVSVAYRWENLSNTVTTYRLQIRLSTKRVLETLEAPPAPTAKNRSILHTTYQGYCAAYNIQ
jgi:hypothetical protein